MCRELLCRLVTCSCSARPTETLSPPPPNARHYAELDVTKIEEDDSLISQERCIKMVTSDSVETIRLAGSNSKTTYQSYNINETMDNSRSSNNDYGQEISHKYHSSSITAYRHQRASNLYRIGYISSFRPGTKFNSSSGRTRLPSMSRGGPSAFRLYTQRLRTTRDTSVQSLFADDVSLYDNLDYGEQVGLWRNKWI